MKRLLSILVAAVMLIMAMTFTAVADEAALQPSVVTARNSEEAAPAAEEVPAVVDEAPVEAAPEVTEEPPAEAPVEAAPEVTEEPPAEVPEEAAPAAEEPPAEVPEVVEEAPAEVVEEAPAEAAAEAPAEAPAVEAPYNENPLTGLADLPDYAIGKRPVAVMINNHPKSYPQLNISQADVLFEIVVEHDLTRFMAMFADYQNVPNLCSVRSYRYYFPAISNGFDAFYIHWGEDTSMMEYYKELNLDSYDGLSNTYLFGRDQNRLDAGYDLEHTSTFYGSLLPDQLAWDEKRTDRDEAHQGPFFDFVPYGTVVTPNGTPCNFADIQFGEQTGQLVYDPETHLYKKFANNEVQIDGITGEQLGFENCILLYTNISDREEDPEANRKWLDSYMLDDERRPGFYLSEGVVQPITWWRGSESDRFHFYDADGNPLSINRGKSYIAITYYDSITTSDTVPEGYAIQ